MSGWACLLGGALLALAPSANPIYKHAPEEYFPAQPALDVAKASRRNDGTALDKLFAQQPGLDSKPDERHPSGRVVPH